MLGPHQSPIYFTWINITNSIIFGIMKDSFMLKKKIKEYEKIVWKSKKICELKKYLKNGVELKLFERKLEFWNLFENWSLENYLKIGVLKLNLRIGILEIKFWNKLEFWKLFKDGVFFK